MRGKRLPRRLLPVWGFSCGDRRVQAAVLAQPWKFASAEVTSTSSTGWGGFQPEYYFWREAKETGRRTKSVKVIVHRVHLHHTQKIRWNTNSCHTFTKIHFQVFALVNKPSWHIFSILNFYTMDRWHVRYSNTLISSSNCLRYSQMPTAF